MNVADWAQLGVGLGVGAAFLAYIIPKLVKYLDEKNTAHANQIADLTRAHKEEIKEIVKDYEARLDAKDERLNKVIDQTYKAVHEMSDAMEKTSDMIVNMRQEFEPLKKAQPLIVQIADKIDKLTNVG